MRKRTLILFLAAILVIIFVSLGVVRNRKFHLVSTDPSSGSSQVPTYQIVTFYFNKPLKAANDVAVDSGSDFNSIDINPSTPGQVKIDGKKIIFKPGVQGFSLNQSYTIKLTNITSAQGETLPDQSLTLKVTYVPFNNLSNNQQQQQINQTDQFHDSNTPRNKLIQSLPYTTSGYSIEYIQSGDYFLVRVTNTPIASQKAAALAYLSKHGIYTKIERIDFFVIRGL